jgi:prepilin-type N-terminal cleavage/methylation domain-containing protein
MRRLPRIRIRATRRSASRRASARRAAPRAGFGLIELMVAIIVLSVGMLGLASLMASALRRDRLTNSYMEVTTLAEAKFEDLRAYGALHYQHTLRSRLNAGGSLTSVVTNYADSVTALNGRTYYRRWTVANGTVVNTRRVTLRVTPKTPLRYDTKSMDFTTLVVLQ